MLWFFLACGDGDKPPGNVSTVTDSGSSPVPIPLVDVSRVHLTGDTVLDLHRSTEPLAFEVSGAEMVLEVVDGEAVVLATLSWDDPVWDGTLAAGGVAEVGQYTLIARDDQDTRASHQIYLIEMSVTQGTFAGSGRLPLTYHHAGGPGQFYSVDHDALSIQVGSKSEVAEVWSDLYEPPDLHGAYNLPVAYIYDTVPTLSLEVDGVAGVPVTLSLDGWTADDEGLFVRDGAWSEAIGVDEEPLTLRVLENDGREVASQSIPMRAYLLPGFPTFASSDDRHQAWIAAVDPLLRDLAGTPDHELSGALVGWIYEDLGLAYDTRYGASVYNTYLSSYDDPVFNMTAFLDRRFGSIVNCSDCAGLVTAYGNMIGLDLEYAHLFGGFDLNYIQAIGSTSFTQCPFDSGRCGFNYHAVVTGDAGGTILDATLALDGDKAPGDAPHELLMVDQIPGEEYSWRLSPDEPDYDSIVKGTLQ